MTNAQWLARSLTLAALACLLAVMNWPSPPELSGAEVLRERIEAFPDPLAANLRAVLPP